MTNDVERDGLRLIQEAISFWWGIVPANAAALSFARDVEAIPSAFAKLDPSNFDDEPADYPAALEQFADPVDLP
ncbi:hypothetical protein [Chelativorans sp. Marseille-P2723]|uniref:hypothetical protein n=1 Tax=Chelativorans sp. Marseille-P2723 TaxID=2709133 RepID=UPI00156D6A96|nr:hypothetical protein [Chelativorans sp. Marseille-P2723]